MPLTPRSHDWEKDTPDEHRLHTHRNAAFLVVDWILSNPAEGVFGWVPHATAFKSMDELCSYIDKPCAVPTATRVIRTVNAQAAPRQLGRQRTGFRTWAARSARQNSPNLSCFAWATHYVRRRPDYSGAIEVPDEELVGETCCSFDYLAVCKDGHACVADRHAFSLDIVDESGDENWTYKYNACPRRISVLVHHGQPCNTREGQIPPHDPECVILVCEDSPHDEPSWKIPDYVSIVKGPDIDGIVPGAGSDAILRSIFNEQICASWTALVAQAVENGRQLEDRVYAHPDDDSQAKALWTASKNWMTIERLLRCHMSVLEEFEESCNDGPMKHFEPDEFMSGVESDEAEGGRKRRANNHRKKANHIRSVDFYEAQKVLKRCLDRVQDDLTKPTTNLLDMLYKSVAIRDARLSLQLNASLWRLSWITFIFLPLTFLSGFFGMNVDLFAGDPSVKWYFISAAALVGVSAILWMVVKVVQRYSIKGQRKSHRYII